MAGVGLVTVNCVTRSPRGEHPSRPLTTTTTTKPTVAVVGGGLSGLAAAHALMRMNSQVHVLEATQRAGGRILTIRSPFRDGQFVEAGATHLVNDPALLRLCASMGVVCRTMETHPGTAASLAIERAAGARGPPTWRPRFTLA